MLIVAHGSEVPGSEQDLLVIGERLRESMEMDVVQAGFLRTNAATLTIAEAAEVCVREGVTDLLVMPYFLTAGYLQRKAVREAADELAKHPHVRMRVGKPLGVHRHLVDVVMERIDEVLGAD